MLDNINCLSAVVSILGVIAIAFVWFCLIPEIPENEWKYYKTQLRISIGVLAFFCIVALVSMVAKGFLCSDILIIQDVINTGK